MTDQEVISSLIEQVSRAAKSTFSERYVRTYITRPFWNLWCKALDIPENSVPTDWNLKNCIRVYGSETIIVESEILASISIPIFCLQNFSKSNKVEAWQRKSKI